MAASLFLYCAQIDFYLITRRPYFVRDRLKYCLTSFFMICCECKLTWSVTIPVIYVKLLVLLVK